MGDRLRRGDALLADATSQSAGVREIETGSELESALRALLVTTPLAWDLDVRLDGTPPAATRSAVRAIVRTALTDATRCRARSVAVAVAGVGGDVAVCVADDGPFGGSRRSDRLRRRLATIGGSLEVRPGPLGGTEVHAYVASLPAASADPVADAPVLRLL